ncbi:MAG TPA: NAD-dependent epimerase/dehydratase family protein [Caulobacterales bacterium]|nr:NAD-dependent epimerase/dehydratase family protein [Caulobacterales bacterium]
MKIMVTGANGFVGMEAVRQLWRDHEVLAVDSLRYGPWRFSEEEMQGFDVDASDLRDRAAVERLMRTFEPDAIIHLAAIHFIPECERLPDEAVSINIQATNNLLNSAPRRSRFVFASTAAVYAPSDVAHRESDILGPMDVYGHSKLAAENFAEYFMSTRDFEAVIVRLFNVVGRGETNPHVLPEIIAQLRRGERRLSLGNIHPKRDYIHVSDAARGFIAAAVQPYPAELGSVPVVNLGSGVSYSVREMIHLLEDVVGARIAVEIDPAKVRKVDRPQLLADNTRMRTLFDWAPAYDLRAALAETWAEAPRKRPAGVAETIDAAHPQA